MTTGLALPAITMCAGSYTTNRDTIHKEVHLILRNAKQVHTFNLGSMKNRMPDECDTSLAGLDDVRLLKVHAVNDACDKERFIEAI